MGSAARLKREREALREKILDAAWEIFAEEGYEGATVRRIADQIDYSPTAIYFHFGDKATLIKAVCDRESLRFAEQMAPLAKVRNPVKRLRAFAAAYVKFAKEHPNEYLVMFVRPRPPVEGLREHPNRGNPNTDAYSLLLRTVQQVLAKNQPTKALDADLVAQAAWSALHGAVSLHLVKEREEWVDWRSLDASVEFLVSAMLAAMEN